MLNKGITGCGATTLAIEQSGNTIIAMPFIGLIENKMHSHGDTVIGIYGAGDRTQEIEDFIGVRKDGIKILATYDSVPKVARILSSLGFNPYSDFSLVIDEWHLLFHSYLFRNGAVRNLLDEAGQFSNTTYISATPIEREYWLEEMQRLPECRIEWPDAVKAKIRTHRTDRPLAYMAGICRDRMRYGKGKNYHIFLNTVSGIADIIRTAGLKPEDVRGVCSRSESSVRKNMDKLPDGFSIESTTDKVKRINFYTSTAFEGQDIFDMDAQVFIVSDAFRGHTMIDISTSFIQICGRIRNADPKMEIVHLYSTTRYCNVTLDEFVRSTEEAVKKAEEVAKWLNTAPENFKPKIRDSIKYMNEPYIRSTDDGIEIDRNLAKFEIVNFKVANGIYGTKVNMEQELVRAGLEITDNSQFKTPKGIRMKTKRRESFKELFEEYAALRGKRGYEAFTADYRRETIEQTEPLVKKAYDILGADKVREMKYKRSNIERKLTAESGKKLDFRIVELLDRELPKYENIPLAVIKDRIQGVYDILRIQRTAKAADIREWYDTKEG